MTMNCSCDHQDRRPKERKAPLRSRVARLVSHPLTNIIWIDEWWHWHPRWQFNRESWEADELPASGTKDGLGRMQIAKECQRLRTLCSRDAQIFLGSDTVMNTVKVMCTGSGQISCSPHWRPSALHGATTPNTPVVSGWTLWTSSPDPDYSERMHSQIIYTLSPIPKA